MFHLYSSPAFCSSQDWVTDVYLILLLFLDCATCSLTPHYSYQCSGNQTVCSRKCGMCLSFFSDVLVPFMWTSSLNCLRQGHALQVTREIHFNPASGWPIKQTLERKRHHASFTLDSPPWNINTDNFWQPPSVFPYVWAPTVVPGLLLKAPRTLHLSISSSQLFSTLSC